MIFNILKKKKYFYLIIMFSRVCSSHQVSPTLHPILLKQKECVRVAVDSVSIGQCHEQAYKEWDKELNNIYEHLMKASPTKETKTALKTSQRAWLKYRDKEFEFLRAYYDQQEGSIWSLVNARMCSNIIKNRVMTLYDLLESIDMSGDTSKNYLFEEDCLS